MGDRGPTPTPKAILQLRGSRAGRKNAKDPTPDPSAPDPPSWLSKAAKDCWRQIVPMLQQQKTLAKIDANALVRYCCEWERWIRATRFVLKNGEKYAIMETDKKTGEERVKCWVQYPETGVVANLGASLLKLEREFGMTPAGRARPIASPQIEKASGIQPRQRGA